jgi:hypothetical protein
MAKINGIEYKTLLVGEGSNAPNAPEIQWGGLYLNGVKLATVLYERNIPDCQPATQLFMMYGYSEKALRAALAEQWGEHYTPADLVSEIKWLEEIEKEFKRHMNQANGGMIVLNYDNSQVNMGIPAQFAEATDEEIMAVLENKVRSSERMYGPLQSYLIFHKPQDFCRGTDFTLEQLAE